MNSLIITIISLMWLMLGYVAGVHEDASNSNIFVCLFMLGIGQAMAYIYETR